MPATAERREEAERAQRETALRPQRDRVAAGTGQGASAATRARLRQNRARSAGGSTSVSWLSEAESSRWKAVAASRPVGVSATDSARRSPGTAVRAIRPRRSARSASPVSAAFSMPSRPASSDMPRAPPVSTHSILACAAGSPWRSATRAKADWVSTDSRISPSATGCSPPVATASTTARSAQDVCYVYSN